MKTSYFMLPLSSLVLLAACAQDPAPSPPATTATSAATVSAPQASAATATTQATPQASAAQATPSTTAGDVAVGKPAPDFTATAQDGTKVHLAALKGKPVVVYFYPKDETPGCTKEACSFRDAWDNLKKTGVTLIGISADNADSHKAFAANHKLPFLLVSDPDGSIAKSYGVPFTQYTARQSFVIDADGNVKKIYRTVDVTKHAQEIAADLGS